MCSGGTLLWNTSAVRLCLIGGLCSDTSSVKDNDGSVNTTVVCTRSIQTLVHMWSCVRLYAGRHILADELVHVWEKRKTDRRRKNMTRIGFKCKSPTTFWGFKKQFKMLNDSKKILIYRAEIRTLVQVTCFHMHVLWTFSTSISFWGQE